MKGYQRAKRSIRLGMPSSSRTFGGERFNLSTATIKPKPIGVATNEAKKAIASGNLVRVVKVKGGNVLYVRRKRAKPKGEASNIHLYPLPAVKKKAKRRKSK